MQFRQILFSRKYVNVAKYYLVTYVNPCSLEGRRSTVEANWTSCLHLAIFLAVLSSLSPLLAVHSLISVPRDLLGISLPLPPPVTFSCTDVVARSLFLITCRNYFGFPLLTIVNSSSSGQAAPLSLLCTSSLVTDFVFVADRLKLPTEKHFKCFDTFFLVLLELAGLTSVTKHGGDNGPLDYLKRNQSNVLIFPYFL